MNKETIFSIILSIITLIIVIGLPIIIFLDYSQPLIFKEACENFEGYYYEMQNTTCSTWHENCIYTCTLHDKFYNLDSLGFGTSQSFNKYFCIEDCRFKNKDKLVCVC